MSSASAASFSGSEGLANNVRGGASLELSYAAEDEDVSANCLANNWEEKEPIFPEEEQDEGEGQIEGKRIFATMEQMTEDKEGPTMGTILLLTQSLWCKWVRRGETCRFSSRWL